MKRVIIFYPFAHQHRRGFELAYKIYFAKTTSVARKLLQIATTDVNGYNKWKVTHELSFRHQAKPNFPLVVLRILYPSYILKLLSSIHFHLLQYTTLYPNSNGFNFEGTCTITNSLLTSASVSWKLFTKGRRKKKKYCT